jgi:hypothetical protein
MGMCEDGLLAYHKTSGHVTFSRPGVDWLRISWRVHSDDWVLLDEALGSL